ncbi:MAG: putative quinol monooxygenase [Acidimicrobiales bacterium]
MDLTTGLLALLEAKPGKEAKVQGFLQWARGVAADEPGTRVWYAFRVGDSTFGIFDAFSDEEGREAHLAGQIPEALGRVGPEFLAGEPDIRPLDILAVKPGG